MTKTTYGGFSLVELGRIQAENDRARRRLLGTASPTQVAQDAATYRAAWWRRGEKRRNRELATLVRALQRRGFPSGGRP